MNAVSRVAEQHGIRAVVVLPDGRTQQLVVDARSALIGSAAHCEIRVDQDFAQREHVELVIDQGVIHIRALSSEPAPLLNNQPFAQAIWAPGAILTIGRLQIGAEVADLSDQKKRFNPFVFLMALPVFAIFGVILYFKSTQDRPIVFPPAPALFDAPIMACPVDSTTATNFAIEKRRVALADRERSPFAPRDALDAVPLFEVSAACFRVVGDSEDADDVANAAALLRRREDEEYRVRRVRLEHAVLENDIDGMARELRVLIPLTAHRRGDYVDFLQRMARIVEMSRGAPKKGLI